MSTQVSGVEKGSPAERAGIAKGDRIVAIDGKPVKEWEELSKTIKASGGKPLNLQIRRGSETVNVDGAADQKEGRNYFWRTQRRLDDRHRQSSFDRKRQSRFSGGTSFLSNLRLFKITLVALLQNDCPAMFRRAISAARF